MQQIFFSKHGEKWTATIRGEQVVISGQDIGWAEICVGIDEVDVALQLVKFGLLGKWSFWDQGERAWLCEVLSDFKGNLLEGLRR